MSQTLEDPIERSPHARRNALIVIVILLLVALAAWAMTRSGSAGGASGGPGGKGAGAGRTNRPTSTVGVAKVVAADMPDTLSAIGTVQPVVTATVRSQIAGTIFSIDFTEGQMVAKGQRLAQIDPRPYRIALAQAEANQARDQAQLNLARVTLRRYQTLLTQDSIARQDVETQAATAKQLEGTVAADAAAINSAQLNLQYTTIPAPVAGKVGLRQVDIGNYVTPGDATGIVVITQTTPIDVAFALPQADLQRLLAQRPAANGLPVIVKDQAGTTELARGQFLTFDNQIDATTGTVKAKARFANPQGRLFPNQFVNAMLVADTLRNVATIPVTAVRHGAQGDFVFVLQPDHSVKLAPVVLGPSDQIRVAILRGLAPGQVVVTEGADNLDDGSKVMLPGEAERQRKAARPGFFARLFGGGQESGQDNRADEGSQARRNHKKPDQNGSAQ